MLSAILRSDIAVKTSIAIMNAFISLRHYLADNAVVFQRLDRIEIKQLETDEKIKKAFEISLNEDEKMLQSLLSRI